MKGSKKVFTVVATPWGILALGFRLELQDYNDRISLDIVPLGLVSQPIYKLAYLYQF